MAEKSILIEDIQPQDIYGANDIYLNLIKNRNPKLRIIARGDEIKAIGEEQEVDEFLKRFQQFNFSLSKGRELNDSLLSEIFGSEDTEAADLSGRNIADNDNNIILFGNNGKPIRARTSNQIKLVQEIAKNDIVFALGPAGTGKTYTAVAVAVKALKNKEIKSSTMRKSLTEE